MVDLSIIISTVDRERMLANALDSVAKSIWTPEAAEVIIVDNGSSDRTAQVCKDIAKQFPRIHWRYFYDDMPGLLTGRHRGAKEAKGEILAYVDDDVLLTPAWLEALQKAFSDPNVVLVGGPSTPAFETNPPSWLEGFWTEFEGGCRCECLSLIQCGDTIKPIDPVYIWGLNFSIRKKTFEDYGGFHPDLIPDTLQRYQGDGESGLAYKIQAAGFVGLYHPAAAVKHVIPAYRLTPVSFARRGFYQGVCDSFTRIRAERRVPAKQPRSWKDFFRPAKRKTERDAILRGPTAEGVRRLYWRAYSAGIQFHQNEVRNDQRLLDWVLRQNYFDYRLPDGWQQYHHARLKARVKPDLKT
jgi:glycosyltransferase involved in cell wall biosynthesis